MRQRVRQRTFVASGEADEAGGAFGDFFGRDVAFAFSRAQFHARDQAAEILIAGARFDEQRIAPAVGGGDFGADVRANRSFFAAR